MSRYFEVLQRASRDEELIPLGDQPEAPSNGRRPQLSGDGLAQDEVTKLVQRLFLLSADGTGPRTVLFCGVEQGEGSSWICARVADILAQQVSETVCMLDANLRSPSLHDRFSAKKRPGLVDALFQSGSVRGLAQPVNGGNLWLVPSGSIVPEAYPRLSAECMRTCLGELRGQFGYVLIDAPPASVHADAALVGKLADGVVLVVEANSTRRQTARQVKESLEAARVRLLGVVLNQRTFPIPETLYRRL